MMAQVILLKIPAATGIDLSSKFTSGLAQADFDGDGFTDIAVMTAPYSLGDVTVTSEDFVLLRNQGNRNHWLTVRLVGTDSNRDGIGARIQVKAGKITPAARGARRE